MTSIIWSPRAIRDVESIRAFIAQDSPSYAELEARRIVAAVERLRMFPESGRRVPERQADTIREIILSPYRLVYRLRGEVAEGVRRALGVGLRRDQRRIKPWARDG